MSVRGLLRLTACVLCILCNRLTGGILCASRTVCGYSVNSSLLLCLDGRHRSHGRLLTGRGTHLPGIGLTLHVRRRRLPGIGLVGRAIGRNLPGIALIGSAVIRIGRNRRSIRRRRLDIRGRCRAGIGPSGHIRRRRLPRIGLIGHSVARRRLPVRRGRLTRIGPEARSRSRSLPRLLGPVLEEIDQPQSQAEHADGKHDKGQRHNQGTFRQLAVRHAAGRKRDHDRNQVAQTVHDDAVLDVVGLIDDEPQQQSALKGIDELYDVHVHDAEQQGRAEDGCRLAVPLEALKYDSAEHQLL